MSKMAIKWLAGGGSVVQFLGAKTYMAESGLGGGREGAAPFVRGGKGCT